MKRFFGIAVAICLAGLVLFGAGPAHAQKVLRIGAGIHFDENVPGVNIALDIPFGEAENAISPFADFFYNSRNQIYTGGLNLVVKKYVGAKGQVYFGGGGGVGYLKSKTDYTTADTPPTTVQISASKTQGMADALFGVEYEATERAAIFVQARWIGLFGGSSQANDQGIKDANGNVVAADLAVKAFALQAGIAFHFGNSI